jgi:tetratricopeptide (TPR) repeat protein
MNMGCASSPPTLDTSSGGLALTPEKEAYFLQLQQVLDHLREDPENVELYMQAGDVTQRLNLWDDARKYYQKAFDLEPRSADAMYKIGYAWEKSGQQYVVGQGMQIIAAQRDNAIKAYQKTIDLSPNYSDAYYRLTLVALNAENIDIAFWASQELNRIEPNSDRSIALVKQVYSSRRR